MVLFARSAAAALLALALPAPLAASPVEVVAVEAENTGGDTWRFSVTLRHDDTGWEHYAERWQVLGPDGQTLLGERVLLHPHVDEQPFTRSQGGIAIPEDVTRVHIRAFDNKGAGSGEPTPFDLPR